MRHDQVGDLAATGQQPSPQLGLGGDVESGRQVVEHEQLSVPQEHPGGGRPLDLAARQLHAPPPDDRVEAGVERPDVVLQHRRSHRGVHVLVAG